MLLGLLYFFGITKAQGRAYLSYFLYIPCVLFVFFSIYTLCCYYTFIVQNNFCLKTLQDLLIQLTLYLGENHLKFQIIYLNETCYFWCIYVVNHVDFNSYDDFSSNFILHMVELEMDLSQNTFAYINIPSNIFCILYFIYYGEFIKN